MYNGKYWHIIMYTNKNYSEFSEENSNKKHNTIENIFSVNG